MSARASRFAGLDATAIGLSSLCLLHCLALPLVASSLTVVSALGELEWLHKAFVLAALPISIFAMSRSLDMRGAVWIVGLAGIGLAMLLVGAFVHAVHDYETHLTVAGALLLAVAHLMRWRMHLSH